jgi:CblD like pilus biogenesis initiator.
MNNIVQETGAAVRGLALLLTCTVPLKAMGDGIGGDRATSFNKTWDISQPPAEPYIYVLDDASYIFETLVVNRGSLLCRSADDPSNGACPTTALWGNRGVTPVRLRFTELKTGKTIDLVLSGQHNSRCGNYTLNTEGGCKWMRGFSVWLSPDELRKLNAGQWTGRLILDAWADGGKKLGVWTADVTLTVTDHFAENAAIYFPQFGTATPRVDLNLHRVNAVQMRGKANLDMCLYDGGIKARSLQMKIEGTSMSGTGFQVVREGSSDAIDYNVSMNYGGGSIPVSRGVLFSLDNVDKAATRPVVLPGQRTAVRCVPAPLALTTQPFNIRDKSAGEYRGILTVAMLMGTQVP